MRRSDVQRRRDTALAFALASIVSITIWSCGGVTPEAHVQNVGEGIEQQGELTECRREGRAAKASAELDGGNAEAGYIAYMTAYEACAKKSDAKHGLDGGAR